MNVTPLAPAEDIGNYRIVLSQANRDDFLATDRGEFWWFSVFGYFRSLRVQALQNTILTPIVHHYRRVGDEDIDDWPQDFHHRSLTVWSRKRRLETLLRRAQQRPGLLAMVQIKRGGNDAHTGFWEKCWAPIFLNGTCLGTLPQTQGKLLHVSCGCFDSSDTVELFFAEAGRDDTAESLLERLFDCVSHLRDQLSSCGATIERSLTTIACRKPQDFFQLAKPAPAAAKAEDHATNPVKALIRIKWPQISTWDKDARQLLESYAGQTAPELFDSFGIFDCQALLSVTQAAELRRKIEETPNRPFHQLTYPLFMRRISKERLKGEKTAPPSADRLKDPDNARHLLRELHQEITRLEKLPRRSKTQCSRPNWLVLHALREVERRFVCLGRTGNIPGSRLLLSSTVYVVSQYASQRPPELSWGRKIESGLLTFLNAVQDELDRRSSFSLPAHTHYYPSAFDAPLKPLGALEMSNRLLGAFLRSYRCLARTTVVNVVVARGSNRSEFHKLMDLCVPVGEGKGRSLQTCLILRTKLEPRTVGHVALSVFLGWFEHFQATVEHLTRGLSYTSLAFYFAECDRIAVLLRTYLREKYRNRSLDPNWPDINVLTNLVGRLAQEDFNIIEALRECFINKDEKLPDNKELLKIAREIFPVRHDGDNPLRWDLHTTALNDVVKAAAIANIGRMAGKKPNMWRQIIHKVEDSLVQPGVDGGRSIEPDSVLGLIATRVWPHTESLELASTLPFLLLFHPEAWAEGENLQKVKEQQINSQLQSAARLVCRVLFEFVLTGPENDQQEEIALIARRLLVGLAATEIWMRLTSGQLHPDPSDHDAITAIFQRHAWQVAKAFARFQDHAAGSVAAHSLLAFGRTLEGISESCGGPKAPPALTSEVISHQVTFLVSLLHTYGNFEAHFDQSADASRALDFIRYFRSFFEAIIDRPDHVVGEIGRLWALQYAVTGPENLPSSPHNHMELRLSHPALAQLFAR